MCARGNLNAVLTFQDSLELLTFCNGDMIGGNVKRGHVLVGQEVVCYFKEITCHCVCLICTSRCTCSVVA